MQQQLDEIFGATGPLAGTVEGYVPRPAQVQMAAAVARALDRDGELICEAGTGTGKTLAYLAPLLLGGVRAIVSTATRQLQEQLFRRDLPLLARALGRGVDAALLKGRSNYLCRHRLRVARAGGWAYEPRVAAAIEAALRWEAITDEGDLAELAELAEVEEGAEIRRLVTSTSDNCLGQECPQYADCFVVAARRRAARADLVVVNHHLYLSDLALKEEGFGELLPAAGAVVLDEAHQLPELAGTFLGERLGSAQLRELADDAQRAQRAEASETPELAEVAAQLRAAVGALAGALSDAAPGDRAAWSALAGRPRVAEMRATVGTVLGRLGDALEVHASRGAELGACARRCSALQGLLARLAAGDGEASRDAVHWVEIRARGFTLHATPLDAGREMSTRARAAGGALVLTSATLAVDGSLASFAARMGLEDAAHEVFDSPFDFRHQTRCYLPRGLPQPSAADYRARVVDTLVPVLEASAGRAFVLCTSHAALAELGTRLAERVPFPLLVQGRAPREVLLQRFRTTANAVLVGTYSFWEGVDVRGPALSCVVVDKLPFAAPGDPVLEARSARARERGESPFASISLPQAVMTLQQGVGRLIRDHHDRGVVVLCDPRLVTRSYGAVFMRSLPPMTVVREIEEVAAFFCDDAVRRQGAT